MTMIDAFPETSERIGGSFRDPAGYVFRRQKGVYRAVTRDWLAIYLELERKGLLGALHDEGLLVETSYINGDEFCRKLCSENPGYEHFLEHRRLWPISYPYEWSVSMLADAAVVTLDLQLRLVQSGFSLKDASAYNVQFSGGGPLFIDVSSIEAPNRLDLWPALGQFSQMFTYPLMLAVHRGWDLRSYFLGNLNGVQVEQVAKAIGFLTRLRPMFWMDVTLPYLLGRGKTAQRADVNELLAIKNSNVGPQVFNLKRLRSKIAGLATAYRPASHWIDYASSCSYDKQGERAKQLLIEEFLERYRPETVLDLGCNTGTYSLIAARAGAKVIAVDQDHDAVETLYRQIRKKPVEITPLVIDLGSPSPAIGFRNRERDGFIDRARSECVFALALIHHLLVTANLSLAAVRDLFADLTDRHLVVEFVPPGDPMFRQLCKRRVGPVQDVSLGDLLRVFAKRFEPCERHAIPNSERTLLFFKKIK